MAEEILCSRELDSALLQEGGGREAQGLHQAVAGPRSEREGAVQSGVAPGG